MLKPSNVVSPYLATCDVLAWPIEILNEIAVRGTDARPPSLCRECGRYVLDTKRGQAPLHAECDTEAKGAARKKIIQRERELQDRFVGIWEKIQPAHFMAVAMIASASDLNHRNHVSSFITVQDRVDGPLRQEVAIGRFDATIEAGRAYDEAMLLATASIEEDKLAFAHTKALPKEPEE